MSGTRAGRLQPAAGGGFPLPLPWVVLPHCAVWIQRGTNSIDLLPPPGSGALEANVLNMAVVGVSANTGAR